MNDVDGATFFPTYPASNFTLSTWLRATNSSPGGTLIGTALTADQFYILWSSQPNEISFGVQVSSVDSRVTTQLQKPQEWNQITAVYDSSRPNGNLVLFVNGLKVGTANQTGPLPFVSMRISHQGNMIVNSCLDEFYVWTRALSDDEALSLYNARHETNLPAPLTDVRSQWRMGEGGIAPIVDKKAFQNISLARGTVEESIESAPTDRVFERGDGSPAYDGDLGRGTDGSEGDLIDP